MITLTVALFNQVRGDDVGNIKKIQLRHDNKGIAAGWFCKQVCYCVDHC